MLYGDVPLIDAANLHALLDAAGEKRRASPPRNIMDNPAGYRRIIRNERGQVVKIVEEKMPPPRKKPSREVNTGILSCPTRHLANWLGALQSNNAQGEYYFNRCGRSCRARRRCHHATTRVGASSCRRRKQQNATG